MTKTLQAAVDKLATLSQEEQDRMGRRLLAILGADSPWTQQLASSLEELEQLAQEHAKFRTSLDVRATTGGKATVAEQRDEVGGVKETLLRIETILLEQQTDIRALRDRLNRNGEQS